MVGSIATAPGAYPRARRKIIGTENTGARDRVVDPARDRALANQERIGDSRQTFERIVIFIGDRFAGAICAGHHQRVRSAGGKEQVLQRGVGQHHAELIVVRSDARKFLLLRSKDNRPRNRLQQRLRIGREFDQALRSLQISSP